MEKYFSVKTKCGHVGKYHCVWINFAIYAETAKEAARKVREIGRVKRHHKDFINSIEKLDFDTFMKLKAQNNADPYLHCKSVQEQRTIEGFEERIELDEYNIARFSKKTTKKESLEFRIKRANAKEKSHKRALKEYFYEEAIAW